MISPRKSINDANIKNMTDSLTIDSGKDNLKCLDFIVVNHLQIQWNQIIQLCYDGAGQNNGCNNDCGALVSHLSVVSCSVLNSTGCLVVMTNNLFD